MRISDWSSDVCSSDLTAIVEEVIAAMPVRMRAAMLDHDDPPPRAGDPIPPLSHWTYLIPSHRQSALAEDGPALRGAFMPPVPLPRRMFAGGRERKGGVEGRGVASRFGLGCRWHV